FFSFFALLPPPPPCSPLFPYTTLFRSFDPASLRRSQACVRCSAADHCLTRRPAGADYGVAGRETASSGRLGLRHVAETHPPARRSEEHTSELQSRENLVCRLLLEKKKK